MPNIIATAEPFLFPGSRTGCLLIHGFTGAPKEMRWMGETLAAQGYSVLGIRLAGHATRPADMIRSRRADWIASVEDGYHILCGLADRIYLVGLSMGGVLSLLMSTRLDVKGVVAISTPFQMPSGLASQLHRLAEQALALHAEKQAAPRLWLVRQESWKDHVSYPQNPVRSIAELQGLLGDMRLALPQVHVPVLLIHSAGRHVRAARKSRIASTAPWSTSLTRPVCS